MATSPVKNNSTTREPGAELADWVVRAGAVQEVMSELNFAVRQRTRRRRRTAQGVAAVLFVGIGLTWLVPYYRHTDSFITVAANRQTLKLTDGSQAELNARTAIKTDFRYGRRIVKLEKGEAFFSVAKDVEHPFLVVTPAGTVRVTGTEFNVRVAGDGLAEVTLLEGSVNVENSGHSDIHLIPGQQFDSGRTDIQTLSATDLNKITAWRQGRALFDRDTLATGAARFAEYHGIAIAVSPEIASLRIGGSYLLADLGEFLEALPKALPVRVIRRDEKTYSLVPR